MDILMVNREDMRALLTMDACIPVLEDAFRVLAGGEAVQPLRPIMWLPDKSGALGLMPGHLGGNFGVMGAKVISVFPGNLNTPYDSHQGFVLLFETENGRPLAVMDGSEMTAIRTAAASAVATKLLAREDARVLAVLGSGAQAKSHVAAMTRVRPIEALRIWSRTPEHRRAFAAECGREYGFPVVETSQAREAVTGADIICTTTAASQPVLLGEWLAPGVHINAVGACVKRARELDTAAVAKARLFVDRRESALNEAGDFIIPREEGAIGDDHILAEIGDLLIGRAPGRQHEKEITLFKSLGIAIEDVAAATHIYRQALKTGTGTRVPW